MRTPGARTAAWRPTTAHLRAAVLGVAGALLALFTHRVDLLAIAAPFLVVAVWGRVSRPTARPALAFTETHLVADEEEGAGAGTRLTGSMPAGCDLLVLGAPRAFHGRYAAVPGTVGRAGPALCLDPSRLSPATPVRWELSRWGTHDLAPVHVAAYSPWLAHAQAPSLGSAPTVLVTPRPQPLPGLGVLPARRGMPGSNPSSALGSGSDLAEVRPYAPGDEPRRVHWPTTSRLGELHIIATTRDVELAVEIVLDVTGLEGAELDTAVRLAAGLSQHLLGRGERVAMTVLGSRGLRPLRAGRGRGQHARVLGLLAAVTPDPASIHDDFQLISELRRPARPGDIAIGIGTGAGPVSRVLLRRQRIGSRTTLLRIPTHAPGDAAGPGPVIDYTGPASVLGLAQTLRRAPAPTTARVR
ncbi:DUF58 domain-containing protein [Actinomycetota bacterium]